MESKEKDIVHMQSTLHLTLYYALHAVISSYQDHNDNTN